MLLGTGFVGLLDEVDDSEPFVKINLESSHVDVQVKQWQRLKMMVASSGNRRAILLCLGLYLCSGVPFFKIS